MEIKENQVNFNRYNVYGTNLAEKNIPEESFWTQMNVTHSGNYKMKLDHFNVFIDGQFGWAGEGPTAEKIQEEIKQYKIFIHVEPEHKDGYNELI
jgi:hypothetical protein